jgi:hypothetical protein
VKNGSPTVAHGFQSKAVALLTFGRDEFGGVHRNRDDNVFDSGLPA